MPDKRSRGISNSAIAIPDVPDAPIVSATDVGTARAFNNGAATVTFSSPTGGLPSSYSITTTPTTVTTPATSSPVTLTGLTSATSYTVSIVPSNVSATGPSATTSAITATTVPQAPNIGTPTVPSAQSYTGNANVSVPFTATGTGGKTITGYTVTSSSGSSASGSSSPILVSDVVGTARTYTVVATNANGSSSASNTSSSATPVSVPQAPTIGTVTDGGTGTTVSVPFTANATGGASITGYSVTSSPATTTQSASSSPYTFTGLTAGTAYTFQVAATNSQGTSSYSAASNSVTPVVPTAYTSIATVTAAGGETSLTFSSIPGTYTDLQIRMISKDTYAGAASASYVGVQFNGDTATNYYYHLLQGNGTAASATASNGTFIQGGKTTYSGTGQTSVYSSSICDIADYTNTSKYKTAKVLAGDDWNVSTTNARISLVSGLWMSTSAITSVTFLPAFTAFAAGSTFALYGVKASA